MPLLLVLPLVLLAAVFAPRAAAQAVPSGPAGGPAEAAADAYLDAAAREAVARFRVRRAAVDRSIAAYETTARQHVHVGARALLRDRMLFGRDVAARILWRRDGVGRVEALGAREVAPAVRGGLAVPERDELASGLGRMAFDPASTNLLGVFARDGGFIRHPLAEGSERDYRFRSGDTTSIRLQGGRTVRLLELEVVPRRREARLLRGSVWLDADSHDAVRAVFELAAPLTLSAAVGDDRVSVEPNAGGDDDEARLSWLLRSVRSELRYVKLEYGLWEERWWLPRLVALEATTRIGSLLDVPVVFEQSYADYRVWTDAAAAPPPEPGLPTLPAEIAADSAAPDSLRRLHRSCRGGQTDRRCYRFSLQLPDDTAALLRSEELPASPYQRGAVLMAESELRELGEVLAGLVPAGERAWHEPELDYALPGPGLLRYNRVEGLALGARASADLGRAAADATLWVPTASLAPSAELGVAHERFSSRYRAAAYHRLEPTEPGTRALGLGNSLSTLLLGRDDGDFFRASGLELTGAPRAPAARDYRWRLFAERQAAAGKATDFSLPHLFTGDTLHANIAAAGALQLGAEATLRWTRGLDPDAPRGGAELQLGAQTGDFHFVRPALRLFGAAPLAGRLSVGMEAAGGTAWGALPVQSEWFLGGPATVRGYGGGSRVHGEAFWRGRLEVGSRLPAARLVVFGDAGWAGARDEWRSTPPLLSAGAGVSLLDGLLRLDLARALRGDHAGWRVDVYLDGAL